MAVYQISYDLRGNRDYEALYDRIRSYGTYARVLESSWVIVTTRTAEQIRDHLARAMDRDDGLLVTRLSGEAAWFGLATNTASWLKGRLERQAA